MEPNNRWVGFRNEREPEPIPAANADDPRMHDVDIRQCRHELPETAGGLDAMVNFAEDLGQPGPGPTSDETCAIQTAARAAPAWGQVLITWCSPSTPPTRCRPSTASSRSGSNRAPTLHLVAGDMNQTPSSALSGCSRAVPGQGLRDQLECDPEGELIDQNMFATIGTDTACGLPRQQCNRHGQPIDRIGGLCAVPVCHCCWLRPRPRAPPS